MEEEEEEGAMELDMEATLAQVLKRKRKRSHKKNQSEATAEKPPEAAPDPEPAQLPAADEHLSSDASEVAVSEFDYSVENHFKAVDTITELCGLRTTLDADQPEIKRFSKSVIFLREWRDFNYAPRIVKFASQRDSKEKDVIGGTTLTQFSAASVPKKETQRGSLGSEASSKDFVMHVGGAVWALDWCARVDRNSENHIKSEFVAVAAHPPESSYHQIGAPLTGRGAIQIWCLLTIYDKEDVLRQGNKKWNEPPRPRGRPRKQPPNDSVEKIDTDSQQGMLTKPPRPRGRPRKKPPSDSVEKIDTDNQQGQPLSIENPMMTKPPRPRGRPRKKHPVDYVEKIDTDSQQGKPLAIEYPMMTKPPRPSRRPRKKPSNDSVEKIDTDSQQGKPLAIEYPMMTKPPRPSGRPRKKPSNDSVEKIDTDSQQGKPLAIEYPMMTKPPRPSGRPRKKPSKDSVEKIDTDSQQGQPLGIGYPMMTKTYSRRTWRPKEKPPNNSVDKIDTNSQHVQTLAIEYPLGSPGSQTSDTTSGNANSHSYHDGSIRTNKDSNQTEHANVFLLADPEGIENKETSEEKGQVQNNNNLPSLRKCENGKSALMNPPACESLNLNSMFLDVNRVSIDSCDANTSKKSIPVDVALPRMMLCLAHNGKVAWDVKWRPANDCDPESMDMMGYLAVLLGNGALEVWEVPLPHTVKLVFPSHQERIDPRFLKLQPVFRCSSLKCGDRQSIPLTVEWSVSSPHDMILAGCHDGVVALWKFSVTEPLTETMPLLSFNADTGPIRTLAWAPQSDLECANVILTGGHKGFKFWDIRDPFRSLWDHHIPGVTYNLDWLQDPSCVFGSTEDGILWLLSLDRPTHDIPVAGKCVTVAPKLGLHSFDCSSFSIWSVEASRQTGVVAYCGEDGTTYCFLPTTRSVRNPSRNRTDHHLCGSLFEDEGALIVASPSADSLFSKNLRLKRPASAKEQEKKEISNGSEDPGGEQLGSEKEKNVVFPPKAVAMHRVRWNVNKGSEKWLCYGGAAGLVRCQEID